MAEPASDGVVGTSRLQALEVDSAHAFRKRAVEAARKRGFPVTTGPVLVQTVKEDWREAANKWLIRWIDEHPDRPLAAEYAAEIDEANDLREQIGASTDPWWMRNPEPDEGGTI